MEDALKQILSGINNIEKEVKDIKENQKYMKSQIKENTEILRKLEHNGTTYNAEINNISMNLSKVQGDVKSIKKDLARVEFNTAENWKQIAILKQS